MDKLDPAVLQPVRAMGSPADQFYTLVDALIIENPNIHGDMEAGSPDQRAIAVIATPDAEIHGGLLQFFWN